MSTTPSLVHRSPEARAGAQRTQLQRVADALAWSLDPTAVATQLIDAACAALDAPWGWVAVLSDDGREAVMLAYRGYDETTMRPWSRVPLEADVPLTVALRTGRAVIHSSAAERISEYPMIERIGNPQQVQASAAVPLVFEGGTTGVLAVTFDRVTTIDASDRWFLEALAAHGAGALERARLFEAVRGRDARLGLALEVSSTWIWQLDLATDRITWIPAPPPIPGAVGDGATAAAWAAAIHPDDRERVRALLDDGLRGRGAFEAEFRLGGVDGPATWLAVVGRPLEEGTGQARTVIGTARDVTERKTAELERNRRLEAEREAIRLRDAFIGVVSHELRTPITTIFGGTRVLSGRWRSLPPATLDSLLADVSDEADRLYRMVEDLLVLTRVERGSLEAGDASVSLRPILDRVLASERARSPEVVFEAVAAADLPSVRGEEMYVEQVLRNLLGNAAKYGGPGSRVTVEATATPGEVVLGVLDRGPGIVEAEAERLFELFYRSPSTASAAAGAGIGLFVCRALALAMGGSLRARARPGGGAVFELALRRCAADDA